MFNLDLYPQLQEFLYTDFFNTDSLPHIFYKTLFAMIAGFGFAYALHPPKKVCFGIIIVAGLGYFIRSILLQSPIFSLAGASFCAALCMGFAAMLLAKYKKVPAEVIVFPALLPMFPGSYGYRSILSLLTFTQHADDPEQITYLLTFFNNITTMLSVSLSLVAGVLAIFIIFHEQSFTMTRGATKISIYQVLRELRKIRKHKQK
ncbi:threonine/serine exporter family protein [Helicobacter trogontum]|uniref:Threonine/serine exporter n=1 Tax=Helicobacter trogontum TaxID=50960 RepID=A0A099VQH5_9HELI|nr:threonine/serine exporter family protein [Helicobacter trogontum]MCI5785838.1 threonine/serine exporter family protein [Helicobacter trogontum]MDY5184887.1 threonine/serine exporter family protein [Helicobacter trogontum]TLD84194.1 threonine/serine exporter [Helicobacter trogontum]TLD99100.1 threonine/serine exporter [Helicobacter trogontum]